MQENKPSLQTFWEKVFQHSSPGYLMGSRPGDKSSSALPIVWKGNKVPANFSHWTSLPQEQEAFTLSNFTLRFPALHLSFCYRVVTYNPQRPYSSGFCCERAPAARSCQGLVWLRIQALHSLLRLPFESANLSFLSLLLAKQDTQWLCVQLSALP